METPSASHPSTAGYHIAGEGKEVFTRFQIRDRIRDGVVSLDTEIAAQGSNDYRAASTFPELSRYFALTAPAAGTAAATAGPVIDPSAPPPAGRVAAGMGYPFTGLAWLLILGAAILQPIPFGAIVAWIVTSVYTLAIIRKSSEGVTTAPPLAEMGSPAQFIIRFLKMVVVTLVSAWPILLAIPLIFVLRSTLVVFAACLIMILYYPAAVATLAKWDSIKFALTPSQIFRFIGMLGADYVIAVVMFFVFILVAAGVGLGVKLMMPGLTKVAEALSTLLFTWASFYFFHLVGWGMYRHRNELQ